MTEAADCDSIANFKFRLESEELVTHSKNTPSPACQGLALSPFRKEPACCNFYLICFHITLAQSVVCRLLSPFKGLKQKQGKH